MVLQPILQPSWLFSIIVGARLRMKEVVLPVSRTKDVKSRYEDLPLAFLFYFYKGWRNEGTGRYKDVSFCYVTQLA